METRMETRLLITTASGFESKAKSEVKLILENARVSQLFMKGNIFVTTKTSLDESITKLLEAKTKYIGLITPVEKRVEISKEKDSIKSLKNEILSLEKLSSSDTFLVRCKRRGTHNFQSRDVERELGMFLERRTEAIVDFDYPKKIVVVEIFQNTAFLGLCMKEKIVRKEIKEFRKYPKGKRPINRAELKLKEAIKHFNISIKSEHRVLDLGASPGGWSKYLSSLAKEVVAVDPAPLDSSLESVKNVVHLKCKSEDLSNFQLGRFDIISNDMNVEPIESANIMNSLSNFLLEKGIGIMTLKFVTRNRRKHIRETLQILEKNYANFRLKKLPHNRFETTLVMHKKVIK